MTLPVDPPPSPRRGQCKNPLNWRLHLNWTKSLTHEFIKYRNSLPREITKHTPENTTLASNWTENKARVARASTGNSLLHSRLGRSHAMLSVGAWGWWQPPSDSTKRNFVLLALPPWYIWTSEHKLVVLCILPDTIKYLTFMYYSETNEPLALSYHVSNMAANSGWLELESDPGFNRFYPHPHVYIFHLQIPRMICASFDNLIVVFLDVGLFSLLIEEFGE